MLFAGTSRSWCSILPRRSDFVRHTGLFIAAAWLFTHGGCTGPGLLGPSGFLLTVDYTAVGALEALALRGYLQPGDELYFGPVKKPVDEETLPVGGPATVSIAVASGLNGAHMRIEATASAGGETLAVGDTTAQVQTGWFVPIFIELEKSVCPNGSVEASEECDDGNDVNTDACRNDCVLPSCGDGILDDFAPFFEQCDFGLGEATVCGQPCESQCAGGQGCGGQLLGECAPNNQGELVCSCNTGFELDGTGTCIDIDECATDNGGCGGLPCTNTTGSHACGDCPDGFETGQNQQCIDIDECATDNGNCGDPTFFLCTNHQGVPPSCSDINECATDNGGCGDPSFYGCVNNVGGPPTCSDIDECAIDNGGCGDQLCTNNEGAAPTCSDNDDGSVNIGFDVTEASFLPPVHGLSLFMTL